MACADGKALIGVLGSGWMRGDAFLIHEAARAQSSFLRLPGRRAGGRSVMVHGRATGASLGDVVPVMIGVMATTRVAGAFTPVYLVFNTIIDITPRASKARCSPVRPLISRACPCAFHRDQPAISAGRSPDYFLRRCRDLAASPAWKGVDVVSPTGKSATVPSLASRQGKVGRRSSQERSELRDVSLRTQDRS